MRLLILSLLIAAGGCAKPAPTAEVPTEKPLRCDTADPQSCDLEGMRFENSVGRPRSKNEAARHYAAACDAGHAAGCTHLGGLYFEKGESEAAHELYKKACEMEDAEGCANLGFMESKAGNPDKARELYTAACEKGSMAACANLADIHQSGRGVPVDHGKAQELFRRACSGGNPSGCIREAWSLAQGCSADTCTSPVDDEKAAAALTGEACATTSEPTICTGFGAHLESGRLVKKSGKRARELYAAACEAQHPWGCERLGTALARGVGGQKDPAGAMTAYQTACDLDFASACSGLGALMLAGDGVDRDEERGAELVRKACGLHEARACNTLILLGL